MVRCGSSIRVLCLHPPGPTHSCLLCVHDDIKTPYFQTKSAPLGWWKEWAGMAGSEGGVGGGGETGS